MFLLECRGDYYWLDFGQFVDWLGDLLEVVFDGFGFLDVVGVESSRLFDGIGGLSLVPVV